MVQSPISHFLLVLLPIFRSVQSLCAYSFYAAWLRRGFCKIPLMDASTCPNLLNHQPTGLAATAQAHPKSYLSVF